VKQHLLIAQIAVLIACGGCQTVSPEPTLAPSVTGQGFVKSWQADLSTGRDFITELHLREQVLVVYTRSNNSFWLDSGGGQMLAINHVASASHTLQPPVVVSDGFIIPTTTTVEVFNKTGRRVASRVSPRALESPAAGAGDSFFIGVSYPGSGRLAKVDIGGERAGLAWEMYTTSGVVAAPAVVGNGVFCGGLDGKVWAVDLARRPLWSLPGDSFQTDGRITADLSADDYGVYVASQDTKLYCLDRGTGKIKWTYYAGLPLVDQPVVLGDMILQRIPNRGMVAIHKTEGKSIRQPLWEQPLAEQVVAADEKHIYVRSGMSTVVALDRTTGKPMFQSHRSDLAVFATNLETPMIYAATRDGTVLGIRPVHTPGTVGEIVLETKMVFPSLASAR
jgi:outer membrane protein assembly factor BamB